MKTNKKTKKEKYFKYLFSIIGIFLYGVVGLIAFMNNTLTTTNRLLGLIFLTYSLSLLIFNIFKRINLVKFHFVEMFFYIVWVF